MCIRDGPRTVDESLRPGEAAEQFVRRLAEEKARLAARAPGEIVLAADTVVELDGEILGKPDSPAQARWMIGQLQGRWHRVLTGICLLGDEESVVDCEITRVRFAALEQPEIDEYVASGEAMDKAGGYGIQGLASKYADRIEGCYFNVVGLPVALVWRHCGRMIRARNI